MAETVSATSTVYMDNSSKKPLLKKIWELFFSKDLNVRKQCEDAYSKASQILGLIHRIIWPVQRPYSVGIIIQVDGKTTP